ncbi:MAG: GTP cyclohydrolase [Sphingobium sp.]|nr:GTP cyclohydrolase [Sphingobium sp.]
MFVIILTYKAELAIVDQYRAAHWEGLDKASADGLLLTGGREVGKKSGILLMRGDREEIEHFAANDAFVVNGVADYAIFEFNPTRIMPGLEAFIQ